MMIQLWAGDLVGFTSSTMRYTSDIKGHVISRITTVLYRDNGLYENNAVIPLQRFWMIEDSVYNEAVLGSLGLV